MSLQQFVDQVSKPLREQEKKSQLAWWNLATTGEEKYSQELKEAKTAWRKIYTSKTDYEFLLGSKAPNNQLLDRQRTLLLNEYKEHQIPFSIIEKMVDLETEVESIYTNFRPTVNGKQLSSNDVKKILMESNASQEREEAWSASKRIGEQVETQVKQLIAMRNDSARKAGFKDFYSMRLELQELDQERLFSQLKQLEEATNPHWQRYKSNLDETLAKRFGIKPTEIKPWHYQDPFFQEAPNQGLNLDNFYENVDALAIGRNFFDVIGLPVDDILDRSDLFEREKKNQHAFCVTIDRNSDVRILCNMRNTEWWMGTLLHELGHAVYEKYTDSSLPFLLRTHAHTSTTESIAMLFGRLSKDGDFLHEYCGIDQKIAKTIDRQARQQTAAGLLVFARWVLTMTHFEQAMYQQPNLDLNKFWWDCVEKYQGVKRIPQRNKPDWASKLHLACAPVYYQNYIIGEMTTSQLLHSLQSYLKKEKEELITSKKTGQWLIDAIFKHGATYQWEQLLEKATGSSLNPQYFANDLRIA